jgi:hypothetical protein
VLDVTQVLKFYSIVYKESATTNEPEMSNGLNWWSKYYASIDAHKKIEREKRVNSDSNQSLFTLFTETSNIDADTTPQGYLDLCKT